MSARRFFLLRLRRDGPLVPARLWLCDHDPADPDNKLDRGRLSPYPRVEIAGHERPPELLLERLGIWGKRGDGAMLPHEAVAALADPNRRIPRRPGHWSYPQPISEGEYRYRVAQLDWMRQHRPDDPRAHPHRRVKADELPLGSFDREHALLEPSS